MREILFSGKTGKGEWVYGDLVRIPNGDSFDCYIISDFDERDSIYDLWKYAIKVIPETVCQYTGLTDKKGKKIFEGDIVKVVYVEKRQYQGVHYDDEHTFVEEVIYSKENACFMLKLMCEDIPMYRPFHNFENLDMIKEIEVVCNVFDNPELLESE